MSQVWRTSSVTAAAIFLETCSLYLVFATISAVVQTPTAKLPFWLVLLAFVWGFALSSRLLTLNVTPRLRGLVGLGLGIPSLLVMAALNTGEGLLPVGALASGDLGIVVGFVVSVIFLIAVWWRAVEVSREEVTLESLRSTFIIGLIVLFVAVLTDSLHPDGIVSGFLVVAFFAVGLTGLAMARFSFESGSPLDISTDWLWPIVASVVVVLVLGLLISGAGVGGLDAVTREVTRTIGNAGFWILQPLLLLLGVLASALVTVGNWVAGFFNGSDLEGLMRAQQDLADFHAGLQEQAKDAKPPTTLFAVLKWSASGVGLVLVTWLLYRFFRARRLLGRPVGVEETRESSFSWKQVNDDLSGVWGNWWSSLFPAGGPARRRGDPADPRQFYHSLLALSERLGEPRKEWQTPREHQWALVGLLPAEPVARIIDRFQAYHYGHAALEPGELDRLRLDWQALNDFLNEQKAGS